MKDHQNSHKRQEDKFAAMNNPLKCEKCSKYFQSKRNLREHVRRVHPVELFQCDLCENYLKTKACLFRHILKLHPAGKNRVKIERDYKILLPSVFKYINPRIKRIE